MATNRTSSQSSAPRGQVGPAARFTGEKVRAQDTRGTLLRLWQYVRVQRAGLLAAALMLVGIVCLTVLSPWLISIAIDDKIAKGDMDGLTVIVLIMTGTYLGSAILQWGQSWIMAGVAQRAVQSVRRDLFAKFQTLPLSYHDRTPHGDKMSRLTNDIDNINTMLTESLGQLVSGTLTAIGVSVAMMLINWQLGLLTLGTLISLSFLVNRLVAKPIRTAYREQQANLGTLNGLVEETITGLRVVKAYNREPELRKSFDQDNHALRAAAIRAQTVSGYVGPSMNFVGNISLLVVAFAGGSLALSGRATVGTIAGFINYTRQFSRPLNELAQTYNTFQSAIAGAERVFNVLDETPELDAPDAVDPGRLLGSVEFRNVNFEYEAGRPILKNVSLEARPGDVVALVGPTGAGKTTIVNLLSSFYAPASGQILIDGKNITRLQREPLRQQMGVVLQDTYMFTGTVMENIRYGRLDATDEEVMEAARLANAEQFIHRLPHGYETVLSERAANVSQGQRQLLAIARAVLADPAILILDEATSSVDTRTEKVIQQAMLRLMEGRTSFVIAHRLSTIRNADQILVVVDGEILERGTHNELVAANGFYAGLYDSQFSSLNAAD